MPGRPVRTLAIGGAVSVALHLVGGAALLRLPAPTPASATEPPDPVERTRLGLDRSRHVTMTWVGFEEPEKHAARESEVEQAHESIDPSGGGGASATETTPEPAPEPEPNPEVVPEPVVPLRPEPTPEPVHVDEPESAPSEAQPEPEPREAEPTERPAPAPAETPGEVGDPSTDTGHASDREAPATSVEEPLEVVMGKPAATEGLTINTRKIHWPVSWELTTRPRSPYVSIHFGPDGKPDKVGVARDPETGRLLGTGIGKIDERLRTEIYRWRGEGEAIDALDADETLEIVMKIIM